MENYCESYEKVRKIIECAYVKVDLLWKQRLFKKHDSEDEFRKAAAASFGKDGYLISEKLLNFIKEEHLEEDFFEK